MKTPKTKYPHQLREFNDTCLLTEIEDKGTYLEKKCSFGLLKFWKETGRITTSRKKLTYLTHKI